VLLKKCIHCIFRLLQSQCLCPLFFLVFKLKMDEALLIFHNELPYNISVYYTSDYCYKVLKSCLIVLVVTYECFKHFLYQNERNINTFVPFTIQVEFCEQYKPFPY